jgi:2-polyprenyl-3-methyl-5-hydroxy-6-metoxy-1,4-benzoquinol methylase/Flp pilus assembly protein TadD
MNRKQRRAGRTHGGAPGSFGSRQSVSPADQLFQLGVAHHNEGRLTEAESIFRRGLQLDPQHSGCLDRLGVLAHQCGHPEAALMLIGQAIAANDGVAEYHYNMGLVLAGLGRMVEAVAHNRRAVSLEPGYADAHTNLGGALGAQGHWSEAALHFRRALARRADSPVAYHNLSVALLAEGKLDEALQVLARGLAVEETKELKQNFAREVVRLRSAPRVSGFMTLIERAAMEGWSRPEEFFPLFTALVKQDRFIAACIERTARSPDHLRKTCPLGPADIAALADSKLLQCMMVSAPVCDAALEHLLTSARRTLLDLAGSSEAQSATEALWSFCCTLARQCFINEYVFHCSDEEEQQARGLRDRLAALLATDATVPALMIGAVATYFPLHSLQVSPRRFNRSWPDAVARVVVQQVEEPETERSLRLSIPALSPVVDDVSSLVREMYEENPYPRWVTALSLNSDLSFDEQMKLMFPHAAFARLGKADVDILIAGCGTGRHVIEIARLYRGAKILAIDLSLASLAHAKRKMNESGLENIEFGQADILELGNLGRTFDVIESVGVLHHLRDPLAGWRVLIGLLRPCGLMRIGLYSALARQSIPAARALIAERGYRQSGHDIRLFRQEIFGLDDNAPAKSLSRSSDFFATSSCRDMFFHVQEHQTTIPAIKEFLAANDLAFLGFDGPMRGEYAERFLADRAMTDLDCWHQFETERPTTFLTMYQFWVQKSAARGI